MVGIISMSPPSCIQTGPEAGRSPELGSSAIWALENPRKLHLASFLHKETELELRSGADTHCDALRHGC